LDGSKTRNQLSLAREGGGGEERRVRLDGAK